MKQYTGNEPRLTSFDRDKAKILNELVNAEPRLREECPERHCVHDMKCTAPDNYWNTCQFTFGKSKDYKECQYFCTGKKPSEAERTIKECDEAIKDCERMIGKKPSEGEE